MRAVLDVEEMGQRVCKEVCGYWRKIKNTKVDSVDELKQKWAYLFEHKCIDCPLEALLQCIREEKGQDAKIEFEYGVEQQIDELKSYGQRCKDEGYDFLGDMLLNAAKTIEWKTLVCDGDLEIEYVE